MVVGSSSSIGRMEGGGGGLTLYHWEGKISRGRGARRRRGGVSDFGVVTAARDEKRGWCPRDGIGRANLIDRLLRGAEGFNKY